MQHNYLSNMSCLLVVMLATQLHYILIICLYMFEQYPTGLFMQLECLFYTLSLTLFSFEKEKMAVQCLDYLDPLNTFKCS